MVVKHFVVNDIIQHIAGDIGSIQDPIDSDDFRFRALTAESDGFLPSPLSTISPCNRTLSAAIKIFQV